MTIGKSGPGEVDQDAEAIAGKFGPFAEVYAENRSDAAELAGDEAAEEHWRKVEQALDGEDRIRPAANWCRKGRLPGGCPQP